MPSSDRELIGALTAGLEPVRRLPSLAVSATAVLAIGLAGIVAVALVSPSFSPLWPRLVGRPDFAGIFVGLGVAGLAGVLAALAGAAPDREGIAQRGVLLAVVSLVAAAGACLTVVAATGAWQGPVDPANAICLGRAAMLALVPASALLFFCLRGWVMRPRLAAGAGLIGSASLGALAIHLGCSEVAPLHQLIGHLAAPVVVTALLLVPLAHVLRRFAR